MVEKQEVARLNQDAVLNESIADLRAKKQALSIKDTELQSLREQLKHMKFGLRLP